MTRITILILLLGFCKNLLAQNCFPNGVMFNKQAQIDSFPLAFPGCLNIVGSVKIDEFEADPIVSLAGLTQIENIGGDLEITNNTLLENLSGLHQLKNLNGNLLIKGNDALASMEALISLKKVGGHVQIVNNSSLQNLNGLSRIKTIDKFVFISSNQALNSLGGLDSLEEVKTVLRIHQNPALTNLSGLQALKRVGTLALDSNINLQHINALSSLFRIQDTLRIRFCGALAQANFPALQQLEGDVVLRNNAQLTTFSLGNATHIAGSIAINNNSALSDLSGLQNIVTVGGDLLINDAAVVNLSGLSACITVGGDLKIINNPALISLDGLQNITTIGGLLGIGRNDNLVSLAGLNNPIPLTDTLAVYDNPLLPTLEGIASMDLSDLTYLVLQSNDQLSYCHISGICQFIQNNPNLTSIENNATQCNSIQQVAFKCTSGTTQSLSESVSVYPNPCDHQIWIRGVSALSDIRCYNHLGQLVQRTAYFQGPNFINTEHLVPGWYYLQSDQGFISSFVKR